MHARNIYYTSPETIMHKNSLSMPSSFFSPIEYGSAVGDEITVTELCKCEGEARVNNRKAKLIFFYEWDVECKWKTKKDKVTMNWAWRITRFCNKIPLYRYRAS